MQPNPFVGVALHGVGAFSSASCYTPQKQTKLWSWEIYWISQATFAWLILPIIVAFLTIPDYLDVVRSSPSIAMWKSLLLGMLYGVGGLSFGMGIRYIGFSLNYAIAIGISAGLGTLMPLIWHPNHGFVLEFADKFSTGPGQVVLGGILVSFLGIALCGWAGMLRERVAAQQQTPDRDLESPGAVRRSLRIGVSLAILAGVLSAVFNFALLAGEPLEKSAVAHGSGDLLKMNAIYPFSHGGAWITNFAWCVFLICRNRTASQFMRLPGTSGSTMAFYYLMALLSGACWYFQFFFYGMGHFHMGREYGFTSWALHMAMLILFSNIYGWLFREWEGMGTTIPKKVLHVGMLVIVIAALIITYGNYLGQQQSSSTAEARSASLRDVVTASHRLTGLGGGS